MVRITEELVRKRAEHNENEIFSLEELTLHQEGIEKIEHLDRWCRELKILYFQDNIISRIENVGKMKKLEYLNLALNNISKIENLEGCESLAKLDLTVNFVDDLQSVESLACNYNLRELFLTGNPCTEFEDYRDFVVATLPQLERLDGKEISRTERILASQKLEETRRKIAVQQREYRKAEEVRRSREPGDEDQSSEEEADSEEEKKFWEKKCDNTPETRVKIAKHVLRSREKRKPSQPKKEPKKERRLFHDDGKAFNINEPKLEFELREESSQWVLDLAVYRHMDSSLLAVDVQPTYIRVLVRNKLFQLALEDEVEPDKSIAKRSTTTGHLEVSMPKLKDSGWEMGPPPRKVEEPRLERLEVKEDRQPMAVLHKIAEEAGRDIGAPGRDDQLVTQHDTFVDNPDVPPLIYA